MPTTRLTSREFNQDVGRAKRAAAAGPVLVTDRGRPSFVLISYEDWTALVGQGRSIAQALAGAPEVADAAFDPPQDRTLPNAADLD
jgi:prevent-host-death family protein